MRIVEAEVLDLALTQALDRYREMKSEDVYAAISQEWPQQMAELLIEFFFKTRCAACGGEFDFVEIARDIGHSNFIALFCGCEWRN